MTDISFFADKIR